MPTISDRRVSNFFDSVATPLPACMRERASDALSLTAPTFAVAADGTLERIPPLSRATESVVHLVVRCRWLPLPPPGFRSPISDR